MRLEALFTPPSEVRSPLELSDSARFVDPKFSGAPLPNCLGDVGGWLRVAERRSATCAFEVYPKEAPAFAPPESALAPSASAPSEVTASVTPKRGKAAQRGGGKVKDAEKTTPPSDGCISLVRRLRENPLGGPSAASSRRAGEGAAAKGELSASSPLASPPDLRGRLGEERLLVHSELDLQNDGSAAGPVVVGLRAFCLRHVRLVQVEEESAFSRWMRAVFGFVAQLAPLLRAGHFLWELINPQTESGFPLFNPRGHYCVSLFVDGLWRVVEVDDLIPVDATPARRPLFPESEDAREIWPQILAKAILKVFRRPLAAGLSPPVVEALTGRIEVRLPLRADLLQSCLSRGLWASVRIPASCKENQKNESSSKGATSPDLPFLVGDVKVEDEAEACVFLLDSNAALPDGLADASGEEPLSGEEPFTEAALPLPFSSVSVSTSESLLEDYSGVLALTSEFHPECRKARAEERERDAQIRRLQVGYDDRGRLLIRRPYSRLLEVLRGATLDANAAVPSVFSAVASEELSLEHSRLHSALEAMPPPSPPSPTEAFASTPLGNSPPRTPTSPSGAASAASGKAEGGASGAAAKAAKLSEFFRQHSAPWMTTSALALPFEGIRFVGGRRLGWSALCGKTDGFFSVFISERAFESASLQEVFSYEKVQAPLPLRAAVFVVSIGRRSEGAVSARTPTLSSERLSADTQEENFRARREDVLSDEKLRSALSPHALFWNLEPGAPVVSELEAAAANPSCVCQILNVDAILPRWRRKAPQLREWKAASSRLFLQTASLLGGEETNAAVSGWISDEGASTAASRVRCTDRRAEEGVESLSKNSWIFRRLETAVSAEVAPPTIPSAPSGRLGLARSGLDRLRLLRGVGSLVLRDSTEAALVDVSEGAFAFLALIHSPAASAPLRLRWRNKPPSAVGLAESFPPPVEASGSGGQSLQQPQQSASIPQTFSLKGPAFASKKDAPLPAADASAFPSSGCSATVFSAEEFLAAHLGYSVQTVEVVAGERWAGASGSRNVWLKAELELRWDLAAERAVGDSPHFLLLPQLPHAGLLPHVRLSVAALSISSAQDHTGTLETTTNAGEATRGREFVGGSSLRSLPVLPFLKVPLEFFASESESTAEGGVLEARLLMLVEATVPLPARAVSFPLSVASAGKGLKVSLLSTAMNASWCGKSPAGGVDGPALGRRRQSPDAEAPPADGLVSCCPCGACECLCGGEGVWVLSEKLQVRGSAAVTLTLRLQVKGPVRGEAEGLLASEDEASTQLCAELLLADASAPFKAAQSSSTAKATSSEERDGGAATPKTTQNSSVLSSKTPRRTLDAAAPGAFAAPHMQSEILLLTETASGSAIEIAHATLHPGCTYILRVARLPRSSARRAQQPEERTRSPLSSARKQETFSCTSLCREGQWEIEVWSSGELTVAPDTRRAEFEALWIANAAAADSGRALKARLTRQNFLEARQAGQAEISTSPPAPPFLAAADGAACGASASSAGSPLCCSLNAASFRQLLLWKLRLTPEELFAALATEQTVACEEGRRGASPFALGEAAATAPFSSTTSTTPTGQEALLDAQSFAESRLLRQALEVSPAALRQLFAEELQVAAGSARLDAAAFAAAFSHASSTGASPKAALAEDVNSTPSAGGGLGGGASRKGTADKKSRPTQQQQSGGASADKTSSGSRGSSAPPAKPAAASRGKDETRKERRSSQGASSSGFGEAALQVLGDRCGCLFSDGLLFPFKPRDFVNEELRRFATPLAGDFKCRVAFLGIAEGTPRKNEEEFDAEAFASLSCDEADGLFFGDGRQTATELQQEESVSSAKEGPSEREPPTFSVFAFSGRSFRDWQMGQPLECTDGGEEDSSSWTAQTDAFAAFLSERKELMENALNSNAAAAEATVRPASPSLVSGEASFTRRSSAALRREALRLLQQRRVDIALRSEELYAACDGSAKEPSREEIERLLGESEETALYKAFPAVHERLQAQTRLFALVAS